MENYRVKLKVKCPYCNEVGYYSTYSFYPPSVAQSYNNERRFMCDCGKTFTTDKYDVIYR